MEDLITVTASSLWFVRQAAAELANASAQAVQDAAADPQVQDAAHKAAQAFYDWAVS